ncbi:uncharacterized protein LOC109863527 [Pseudomyrmex gracilis]|uniref:uncharacterized protein LOC109863527 n=1 Tax=Pseudomyrmex gracilis TaxID=219809 RepID=UPI000995BDC0|nr:uncharacterized protein LOC109863527 [Pseudomyrmex gracilis]
MESFTWTDASTRLFIELYKEKKDLLTNRKIKTKKILWEIISESMKLEGYIVTPTQLENKLKLLERSYKNMVTHNKQTGRGRITCAYQTELTELLGQKHNIEPVAVCGKNGLILRKEQPSASQIEEIDKELMSAENRCTQNENIKFNITSALQENQEEQNTINMELTQNTSPNQKSSKYNNID